MQKLNKISVYYLWVIILSIVILSLIFVQFFDPKNNSSEKVLVGVIDSGCGENANYVSEYHTFTTTIFGYPNDELTVHDTLSHGTYVCEIINGYAPQASIYSAKIANSQGILTYEGIIAAIQWLAEEINVDIINLSLGSEPLVSKLLEEVLDNYKDSTIIVASSGNTGSSNYNTYGLADWPATLPWTIGVGAVDQASNDIAAYYSAKGRSFYGPYVTEFADIGNYKNKYGTSFSTPAITGKIALLLSKLHNIDIYPTPGEIVTILSQTTDNWKLNRFDDTIGWGVPSVNYNINTLLNPRIVIHGKEETDPLTRIINEKWSVSWKINSYGISQSEYKNINFEFTGNATNSLIGYQFTFSEWGGILTLTFKTSSNPGLYELSIFNDLSNQITYRYNTTTKNLGSILLDHRFSINGYGHPYGEFFQLEMLLRNSGYIVHQQLVDTTDISLQNYKTIFLPEFYQKITHEQMTINRTIPDYLTSSYLDYIKSGGNLLIFMDVPDQTNYKTSIPLLEHLGANYTGTNIGGIDNVIYTSNFSNNPIFEGVSNINFSGGEIKKVNNSIEEIGWYKKFGNNPIFPKYKYLSIGVLGSLGGGSYFIFGATNIITNQYLISYTGYQMDRIITNFLTLYN